MHKDATLNIAGIYTAECKSCLRASSNPKVCSMNDISFEFATHKRVLTRLSDRPWYTHILLEFLLSVLWFHWLQVYIPLKASPADSKLSWHVPLSIACAVRILDVHCSIYASILFRLTIPARLRANRLITAYSKGIPHPNTMSLVTPRIKLPSEGTLDNWLLVWICVKMI